MVTWRRFSVEIVAPISVIIPYYNRQSFIDECLDSVFRQTLAPAEIIVVDDASEIQQRRYLDKFLPRIRIIDLPVNRGVAGARNAGIDAASQEWIAFNDSDDIWELNKLELQWQHLQANPDCRGVHTPIRSFFADGSEHVSDPPASPLALSDALHQNIIRVQSLLVRTDVLRALHGFDSTLRVCEDDDLGIRLALHGDRIDCMPAPLARMRRTHNDHLWGNNLRRMIAGKTAVAWRHRVILERTLGPGATRRRIAHALRKIGHDRGRILGRMLFAGGWILGGFDTATD